jgi:beta-galactosidase
MKKLTSFLTGFLLSALVVFNIMALKAQETHEFTFNQSEFRLDNKPFQIISGEIHPARVPEIYWRHRIQMARAMGCNTIAAYIFWNYHETKPNEFDFTTGNKNIARFIRICQEEGMWVLLRPGPYVCGEWDFGGLPAFLLNTPDIRIRCSDSRYLSEVKDYIKRLAKEVEPLQCIHGGPILMVQIENEYGSYGNDKVYLEALRSLWIENGFHIPFYTSDGATPYMLDAGTIEGAAIGLNPGGNENDFNVARKFNPNVPVFSCETYPGWLTHWGEKWARSDTVSLKKQLEYLLKNKKSFNLYVIHGGTNFGFTAGANAFSPTQYQPDITSYDYGAPINEQGQPTPQFFMLRRLIAKYVSYKIPGLPDPIAAIQIPPIEMIKANNLWNYHFPSVLTPQPKPMEAFQQNQGLILYKTKLVGHKSGKLKIWEPHDYALVFLNGKFIDTVYRDGGNWEVDLPATLEKDPVLEILVEGMGHINFAEFMIDRKGITDRVTLNEMTLMNWETTLLPMDEIFIEQLKITPANKMLYQKPCNFFKGKFNLTATGDVYFDLSKYVKGMVYVNGHNLGRYWNKGPQLRLYCPSDWLIPGENEIIVFDFLQMEAKPIAGRRTLSGSE